MHRAVALTAVLTTVAAVTFTSGPTAAAAPYKGANTAGVQEDFNGDGYADLLVGTPREAVNGKDARGSVTVLWGGPDGLTGGATIDPPARFGESQPYCRFGMAMAAGDMNGDGAPELAVGSGCEISSYTGPFTRGGKAASQYREWRVGARDVVMGDVNGDGRPERFWLPGPTGGDVRGPVLLDRGPVDSSDPFKNAPVKLPHADGYTGRIADVNGDGYGDLITGIPEDGVIGGETGAHKGGEIQVLYGSAQGITADQQPRVFHQDTPGIPGAAEVADRFGWSLGTGDINADGYADVLVGVPGEAIGTRAYAGGAVVLYGSAAGLTTHKSVAYSQDSAGVPGSAETDDGFGGAVHLADLNRDGKAEALVGIPYENTDGCVWIARGTATGPATTGSANLCGKDTGLTLRGFHGLFGDALPSARVGY